MYDTHQAQQASLLAGMAAAVVGAHAALKTPMAASWPADVMARAPSAALPMHSSPTANTAPGECPLQGQQVSRYVFGSGHKVFSRPCGDTQ